MARSAKPVRESADNVSAVPGLWSVLDVRVSLENSNPGREWLPAIRYNSLEHRVPALYTATTSLGCVRLPQSVP